MGKVSVLHLANALSARILDIRARICLHAGMNRDSSWLRAASGTLQAPVSRIEILSC